MKKILLFAMVLGLLIGNFSLVEGKTWKEMTVEERLSYVIALRPDLSINEAALRTAESYEAYLTAIQEGLDKWREEERKEREKEIAESQKSIEKEQAKRTAKEQQRQARIKQFPIDIQNHIKNHQVKLGMTTEQVELSLGKPNRINRHVGKWGVNEQWVYGYSYLYFENGILTSWQD